MNFSPALSQLYRDKVVHHVGGLTSYTTFIRTRPDWERIIENFDFERLLTDLKNGRLMTISELNATKIDVRIIHIVI